MRKGWGTRPTWWAELGVPIRCGGCKKPWALNASGLGGPSGSWVHCECRGAGESRGHQIWICGATPGCRWEWWPDHDPGWVEPPERPLVL